MESKLDFDTIYHTYFLKIRGYLSMLIGPYHAEDVAQEVFNKVSIHLGDLTDGTKLSAWIYRIATNAAIDQARTPSFRHLDGNVEEEHVKGVCDRNVWTGKESNLTEQRLIKEEMRTCVQEFIGRLPEAYRSILILKDYEEKSNKEIAEILDLTVPAVKIRYHRAKNMLKKELDAGCHFFYDDENRLLCDRKQTPLIRKKISE